MHFIGLLVILIKFMNAEDRGKENYSYEIKAVGGFYLFLRRIQKTMYRVFTPKMTTFILFVALHLLLLSPPAYSQSNPHPLGDWLDAHPNVGGNILWRFSYDISDSKSWVQWNAQDRQDLFDIYDEIVLGNYPNFPDPLPNAAVIPNHLTYLTYASAKQLYFSYLAMALYYEVNNLLPWSILDLNNTELFELFSYTRYFTVTSSRDDALLRINELCINSIFRHK